MSRSRAWGLWVAAVTICPAVIASIAFAFRAHWVSPDRSGWSGRIIAMLLLAHAILCLAAAIAPPRPARGGWYWPALGLVLADFWLTFVLAYAAGMASYYE